MVKVLERIEEWLSVAIEREANEAIEDIKLGKLGKAETMIKRIIQQDMVEFVLGLRELQREGVTRPKLKRYITSLERLRIKILRDAKIALRDIEKGLYEKAIGVLNTIKEEAGAAFGGEAVSGRK